MRIFSIASFPPTRAYIRITRSYTVSTALKKYKNNQEKRKENSLWECRGNASHRR